MNRFDLESRLICFSVLIIDIVKEMPKSKIGDHLYGQLIRSGTSVSLNYGEAQSAESKRDFIHKMKVILKELRETYICLKIIQLSDLYKTDKKIVKTKTPNRKPFLFMLKVSITPKNLQSQNR